MASVADVLLCVSVSVPAVGLHVKEQTRSHTNIEGHFKDSMMVFGLWENHFSTTPTANMQSVGARLRGAALITPQSFNTA